MNPAVDYSDAPSIDPNPPLAGSPWTLDLFTHFVKVLLGCVAGKQHIQSRLLLAHPHFRDYRISLRRRSHVPRHSGIIERYSLSKAQTCPVGHQTRIPVGSFC